MPGPPDLAKSEPGVRGARPGDLADRILTQLDRHVRSPTQEHSRMCSCGVVVEPGKWHRHLADSIIAAMTREAGDSDS